MGARPMLCVLGVVAAAGCTTADPCADGVPGTVCQVAGTGELAFNGDHKQANDTAFYLPSELRRGPDGLLYIMDFNNMRLRRIEADGSVSTIAGAGIHTGASVGWQATESALENPIDFDFLPDGRIVFVSYHDPRVLMIDFDGTIQLVAGSLQAPVPGREGDNGPALDATFRELVGIAVAPDGSIYLADDQAHRVRKITDGIITTVAGNGHDGYSGDGGLATSAMISAPTGLTFDAAGALYLADTGNCAVRKVSPDGSITTVAGVGRVGYMGDGGAATAAMLAHEEGIAVAPDGTVYIADRFNYRIRTIATDGTIDTFMGTGESGNAGNGGDYRDATIGKISRLQFDTDGSLLIADQTNSLLRRVIAPF